MVSSTLISWRLLVSCGCGCLPSPTDAESQDSDQFCCSCCIIPSSLSRLSFVLFLWQSQMVVSPLLLITTTTTLSCGNQLPSSPTLHKSMTPNTIFILLHLKVCIVQLCVYMQNFASLGTALGFRNFLNEVPGLPASYGSFQKLRSARYPPPPVWRETVSKKHNINYNATVHLSHFNIPTQHTILAHNTTTHETNTPTTPITTPNPATTPNAAPAPAQHQPQPSTTPITTPITRKSQHQSQHRACKLPTFWFFVFMLFF